MRREPLSQRLLAIELRTAIDRALRRPWDTSAQRRAIDLAAAHPHGVASSHVRHNLKPHRLAWLASARALSGLGDPPRWAKKEDS